MHGTAGLAVELHGGRLGGEGETVATLGYYRVLGDLEIERACSGGLEPHSVVGPRGRCRLDIVAGYLGSARILGEHFDVVGGPGVLEVTVSFTGDLSKVDGQVARNPALGRALKESRVRTITEHYIDILSLGPVYIEVVIVRGWGSVR